MDTVMGGRINRFQMSDNKMLSDEPEKRAIRPNQIYIVCLTNFFITDIFLFYVLKNLLTSQKFLDEFRWYTSILFRWYTNTIVFFFFKNLLASQKFLDDEFRWQYFSSGLKKTHFRYCKFHIVCKIRLQQTTYSVCHTPSET